ncbi:MAG: hypothetical protein R6U17_10020, partial [Thermoplasmata archaeon]
LIEEDDTLFTWQNTDTSGLFDNTDTGEYDVTASYEGVTSEPTVVTVEPEDVDYVVISPDGTETITAGDTLEFTAYAYDRYDNLITDSTVEFAWQNAENGIFNKYIAGLYEVTATYKGVTSAPTIVTVQNDDVHTIDITPSADTTIKAGETVNFSAAAYDQYGNLIEEDDTLFTWQNTDTSGLFDNTDTGEYDVTASYEGVTSEPTVVTVEPEDVDYVVISPDGTETITAGDTLEFTAYAYDRYDNLITDSTMDFAWQNAENGIFNKYVAGLYEVTAIYSGVSSSPTTMTVEPTDIDRIEIAPHEEQNIQAGQTIEFSAIAYDEYDNPVENDNEEFLWINTDENGVFHQSDAGEYQVTASYGDITSSPTSVTVVPGEADYIILSPQERDTIEAGVILQFSAEAYDGYDNLITDSTTDFSWKNADRFGIFNKSRVGKYNITASYKGVTSGVITITVEPAEVCLVTITPDTSQTINAGQTVEFSAAAYDEYGNMIEDHAAEFIWVNTDDSGLFVEATAGEYDVTAAYQEVISDSITVIVEPGDTGSIVITPEDSNVTAGDTQTYTATAYDEYGNEFDVTGDIHWSIDEEAGGGWVNNVYTSRFAGSWTVTATYGTLEDTASLTVEPTEAYRLFITPGISTITADDTEIYSAVVYDRFNNEVEDVTDEINWSIENAAGGEWDKNIYISQFTGIWTITGQCGNLTDNAILTVEPGAVEIVNIYPSQGQTVSVGQDILFSAEAYDGSGNLLSDDARDFAWNNAINGIFNQNDVGNYEVTATYQNVTSDTTNVMVEKANFVIEITDFDDKVKEGERLTISYRVVNTGGVEGTYDIVFNIDGNQFKIYPDLKLDVDEEFNGRFTWKTEEKGTYELEITNEHDTASVKASVESDTGINLSNYYWLVILFLLIAVIVLLFAAKFLKEEFIDTRIKESDTGDGVETYDHDEVEKIKEKEYENSQAAMASLKSNYRRYNEYAKRLEYLEKRESVLDEKLANNDIAKDNYDRAIGNIEINKLDIEEKLTSLQDEILE